MNTQLISSILLLALALPIKGCRNEAIAPSISEYDCTKNSPHVLIPGTPGITMKSSRCKDYIYTRKAMAAAIDVFAEIYGEEFNLNHLEVLELLSNLKIEVSILPKTIANVYDLKGNFYKNPVPISGLAIDKDHIWVEIKTSNIYNSALIHELVHIIIWRANVVHGDPDHEGKEFSGWSKKHTSLIERVNNTLMDLNI